MMIKAINARRIVSALTLGLFCIQSFAFNQPDTPTYGQSASLNVENQCIVQFSSTVSTDEVPSLAKGLAKKANANIKHIYKHSIKGMAIHRPCRAVQAQLAKHKLVTELVPDGVVTASKGKPIKSGGGGQVIPWSVTYVNGPQSGDGFTAWVIDSGIDLNHPDLMVDASRGFSAITDKKQPSMDDANGHGTHVAGIIAAIDNNQGVVGIAAGATVIPVRVLDRRGNGSWSGVIAGIDFVAQHAGPGDCVNMSLSGGAHNGVDYAVETAAAKTGAYFVSAAGNQGVSATTRSPARVNGTGIFTISAIDENGNLPSWSNFDTPPVDFAAPGVSILSLYKGGGTATMSGTSMASPAACAILMLSNGNPSIDGVAGNDPDGTPDPIISL